MSIQSVPPLISIVIPAYNSGLTIERTIKSIFAQTYENIEIIIIDDCSNDNTLEIIKDYAKKHPSIKFHSFSENNGPNIARNKGIEISQGKFVAFCDSDDEWFPLKLEKQYKKFSTSIYQNLGLVYCGLIKNYEKGMISFKNNNYIGSIMDKLMVENFIGGASVVLIKREIFDNIGFFDESPLLRKGGAQDYEMWIRIAKKFDIDVVPEILVKYNICNNSISVQSQTNYPDLRIKSRLYIWRKNKEHFIKHRNSYVSVLISIGPDLIHLNRMRLLKKYIKNGVKFNSFDLRIYYHLFLLRFIPYFPNIIILWNLPTRVIRLIRYIPDYIKYLLK